MVHKDKIINGVFYLSVGVILILLALQTVHDTDVWLHLGIGKYIVEHRALPAGDIFTYTRYGQPYEYLEWLFEVGLYLLYNFFGYHGLMIFKLGLWLLTMSLLWQWMKDEGVESRWAAFFTLFPAYWLALRWQERPEVVGFFFLALYLAVLSQYRRGRNYLYFLPWVQIVGINVHPGALLGVVVFAVILAGEILDYLKDKNENDLRVIKALAVMIPLLAGASFLNPYGYKLVIDPFFYSQQKALKEAVFEWMPIWRFSYYHYAYLAFLIPGALSFIPRLLPPREHLKISDLLLFLFGGILPYISIRYVAVFAVISLPLVGKNFYWWFTNWPVSQRIWEKGIQKVSGAKWGLPVVVLVGGGILFVFYHPRVFLGWGPDKYAVPQRALDFIQRNSIPGNIFNEYEWGGYIILEAYPRYLPYTDSRVFDFKNFKECYDVMGAKAGWEKLLNHRGVNLIMIKSLNPVNGSLWPLVPELLKSPNWLLVWSEDATLVFLQNSTQNQFWAQRFALPKTKVFEEVIVEGKYLTDRLTKVRTYYSMGWAYMNLGKFAEAKNAYQKHLKTDPRDEAARKYLELLIQQGY